MFLPLTVTSPVAAVIWIPLRPSITTVPSLVIFTVVPVLSSTRLYPSPAVATVIDSLVDLTSLKTSRWPSRLVNRRSVTASLPRLPSGAGALSTVLYSPPST